MRRVRMQHHTVARRPPAPDGDGTSGDRVTVHVHAPADVEAVVVAAKSGRLVDAVVVGDDAQALRLLETVAGELRRVGPHVRVLESAPPAPAARPLDDQEQSLLDLLAVGMTVAQAARRLGLSSRTATRRIQAARERLGVGSTAEAIVASRPVRGGRVPEWSRTGLVGRDDLLAHVVDLLGGDAAVLLVGEGAVGKTALLDAIVLADGRASHRSGGLETMAWRDQWAIRDAAGLPWDEDDADALASRVEAVVGPDLLVMDDLHLADAGSRRMLGALAERLAILAAARPDAGDVIGELCEAGFTRVDVPPLSEEAMADLVRALRPRARPGDVTDIVSRAGGLPLLAEFLCRGEPGLGVGRGLAPTVDALPDDAARAALLLALAGGPMPETASTPALVAAGVAVSAGDGVRIRHALVADAVLARVQPEDVADAHRALADHALTAGDVASAARHRLAAGEGAMAEAIALDGARTAATAAERAQLLLVAAQGAWTQGRGERAPEALQALSASGRHTEVLRLSEGIPPADPAASAVYALTRARAHWHAGDSARAVTEARAGLSLSAGVDPGVAAALLRETVRCELLSLGPQPDHAGLLERADLLTASLDRGRAGQLTVAGLYAYFAGGASAAELWEQGRAAAEAEGDVDSLMRCSNNLISWNEGDGDPDVALALAEQMIPVAESHGLGEWHAQFMAMAANLHFHLGNYPAAMSLLDAIDAVVVDGQTRQQADGTRLASLIDLGLLEDAARLIPSSSGTDSRDWLRDDTVAYLRAAHAYWSGDLRTALELTAPLLDLSGEAILVWFPRSLRAWAQYDLQEPVDVPTGGPSFRIVAGVVREIEAIRLLQDDPAEAVPVFDEAAQVGRHGSYALTVRAAWGAGEAARLASMDGAVDRLLGVEKLCLEAGLEPLLAKVQRSLRQAGVRRTARRAPDRSGLMTERERVVLELAARGATYDEIARRLGVGRSTVRRLLESARARLGAAGKFAAVASLPDD